MSRNERIAAPVVASPGYFEDRRAVGNMTSPGWFL